jgi:hypothetical protein
MLGFYLCVHTYVCMKGIQIHFIMCTYICTIHIVHMYEGHTDTLQLRSPQQLR